MRLDDEDDTAFIEEEEEDDEDVSGIIGDVDDEEESLIARYQAVSRAGSVCLTLATPDDRCLIPGGAIAQLGERLNGIQEVGGSTPPGSTTSARL